MLKFDTNFNRMDEQGMRNQYVGKNMAELQATIDSVGKEVDSIGNMHANNLREYPYVGVRGYDNSFVDGKLVRTRHPEVKLAKVIDVDSVLRGSSSGERINYLQQGLVKAQRLRQEYEFKSMDLAEKQKSVRRHAIELQKKFTLSFACIIFFFIGAPLGAIIRKGGLGTPLVISVFLFIFYYIIDNTGYKLARDGKWDVIEGMWLSAAVLLPMGIFFTYKAVNDSAVFNKDAYLNFFRRFFGVSEVRHVEMKELVMDEVVPAVAVERLEKLKREVKAFLEANPANQAYVAYWLRGYDRDSLHLLRDEIETDVDYLSNSREKMVVLKLMDLPVLRSLWFQQPSRKRWLSRVMMVLFPIGLPVWLYGRKTQRDLRHELSTVVKVSDELIALLEKDKDDTAVS